VERLSARRVLRPDGSLRPGTVVLDGGRVDAVLDDPGPSPPDLTLAPGLVDLQVNGLGGLDVWRGDLDALGRTLSDAGTTAWCPTLTSAPLDAYGAWFDAHPAPAPGEIGVHLEGPFLHPARAGAHAPDHLRPTDPVWLDALPARVRLVTLAPELTGGLDAVRRLRARGVTVAIGHSNATYDEAVAAADAGATLVTHVFNAMAPMHHRDPGLAGAALADERLTPAVIGDGVHVHPAVLALVLRTGRAVLVSDSVQARSARRPDGSLGGSTVTLADAVRIAVGAGVPLATALVAATARPAAVIGRADLGRLEPGARGGVVALDVSLRVIRVASG
jgi:N-acetylglucosamine-6-phosphate deacetylase